MKKFEMVKQKKRTHITQSGKNCIIKLRHPRRALDLKAKDLIGSSKAYCLLADHNPEFRCVICTGITLFALVLHFFCTCVTHFCTPFSANQNRVIFACMFNN